MPRSQRGSIQDLGADREKRYRARYRDGSGRERSKTFVKKGDARRWLTGQVADLDRGQHVDPTAGKETLEAWSEKWLDSLRDLKPKTEATYRELLRSKVLPALGRLQLSSITPARVRRWLADMDAEGLSGARQRQALQVLGAMLELAVADELLVKNPAKGKGVKAPKVRKRRQVVLSPAEVRRLALAAENHDPDAGVLVLTLAYSGLRWGEAVALRRRAVRFEHRPDGSVLAHLHVRESATEVPGRGLVFGKPKTHEDRTVVLPPFVSEELLAHVEGDPPRGPEDLVFTAPMGGPLHASNWRRKVWDLACEDADMPTPDDPPDHLVIHDLRDTAASLMIRTGATIKQVQNALGHSSAAMTLDTYGSLYQDSLVDLADRMEAYRDEETAPNAAQNAAQTARVVAFTQR